MRKRAASAALFSAPHILRISTGLRTGTSESRTYDFLMPAVFSNAESGFAARAEDDVARLRIPPHSVEAEQSVLGGLLLDNSAWDRAGDLLTESDFYRFEHRLIYAAIAGLVNATRPADVIT